MLKHKLWLYSVHSNGDQIIFCKQQITFSVSMGSKLLLQFITVTWVYTYIQQQFSSNYSPLRNHALKRRIEFAICYIFNVSCLVKGLIWILVKLVHATEFECSKLNARVWKHSPHAYNHVNLVSKNKVKQVNKCEERVVKHFNNTQKVSQPKLQYVYLE